jgi:hypothetical protein
MQLTTPTDYFAFTGAGANTPVSWQALIEDAKAATTWSFFKLTI